MSETITGHGPVLGIDDMHVATGHHVLELDALAAARGVDPAKYRIGLGQHQFSVLAEDEDIVTMAIAAAKPIIERAGVDRIRTVLFATESGVDQSKSAGVYVHRMLGLPAACRVVELKQACYSAIAGLQMALALVARHPEEQVLVIASDVARYEMPGAAEPTQGGAAAAMLVTADPRLLVVDDAVGLHTLDVDDFWRPNDHTTAIVDGALSTTAYLDSLVGAWDDYVAHGGRPAAEIDRFAYHQPFTKMAIKAHRRLAEHTGIDLPGDTYETGLVYNQRMGNSYTASLVVAMAALLDAEDDLDDKVIGMFSYGSGSVGEFFSATVVPGYRELLRRTLVDELDARVPLTVAEYEAIHVAAGLPSSRERDTASITTAPVRFSGVHGSARQYEARG